MLKQIRYISYDLNINKYLYKIIDNDFISEVHVGTDTIISSRSMATAAAVVEYSRRTLNVAKNLAHYYINAHARNGYDLTLIINDIRRDLDQYYAELEFGSKHYDCILNQIRMRQYSKFIRK